LIPGRDEGTLLVKVAQRFRPRPQPRYRSRAVFHLPRSTRFMLVSAFCQLDGMKQAYAHAIESGYRFYSYGDACLLFRGKAP
jgi:S-adenosylmethionine:tRNA ribosyltransferase-isomerase